VETSKHITKRDLVVRISNETGLVQQQVLDVVQKTLDYISESVSKGDTVELRNFGVFEVKLRKARVGRNPNSPETDVPIPPRAVVKFKPGKEMREAVLQGEPETESANGNARANNAEIPAMHRASTIIQPADRANFRVRA
jgi:nucleoid DNA-binding protein